MSLVLPISRKALSKNALQSLAATARGIADSVGVSDEKKDGASTPVALPEVKEVVTADVISGAPRTCNIRIYVAGHSLHASGTPSSFCAHIPTNAEHNAEWRNPTRALAN
jgi:hypothetical protein